ncbi:MAG TPA: DUF2207 domain-containing protein [Galbitalea sp.]|jgi:uncharacterized membrane protein YgcG
MRSRVALGIVVAIGAILALAGCTSLGSSSPGDTEHIDSFDVHYTIEQSGLVHAVETVHYDFADEPAKHGIFRYLYSRFPAPEGKDRVYEYTNIHVSSPTGASALFSTAKQASVEIKVGNENATLNGKQTYVISYDIRGALNASKQDDGTTLDEFYWNVTGYDWPVTMNKVAVTLSSPTAVSRVACYQGPPTSTEPCPTEGAIGASSAFFRTSNITTGQGLTIDAGWPAGTFAQTDPIIETHLPADAPLVVSGSNDGPDPFWTPWNWGGGLLLLVLIPVGYLLLIVARRRDAEFTGETPGTIPSDQANAPVGVAPLHETIVAQYQPPAGFPVGAANLLLYKQRKNVDITATLVDLAVRHHLRIEESGGATGGKRTSKDYTLVATPELVKATEPALLAHEQLLLDKIFAGGRASVTLTELNNTFSANFASVKSALESFVDSGKFFRDKVSRTHPFIALAIAASVLVFFGMVFVEKAWVFIPIGAFIGSILALAEGSRAIRRSALGHAIYLQLAGFHVYIATAEVNQIKFEENIDVFSRYLPWAIAFGQTKRWAKVFEKLAEEGTYTTTPDWYVGSYIGASNLGAIAAISSIGAAVSNFTDVATTAMSSSPATVSSTGGSGFSSFGGGFGGGGGFSGGGGGGGGGGSW